MLRISTLDGHQRMSTQELLQLVAQAVENGETEFNILASGQHDIGGPLWNRAGKPLHFNITNPGQRAELSPFAGMQEIQPAIALQMEKFILVAAREPAPAH